MSQEPSYQPEPWRPPRALRPTPPGPGWLPVAAIGAGTVAAATVPGVAPGAGLAVGVAAIAAALVPAIWQRRDLHTVGFGSVAVVLACLPAIRDAGWLAALSLLAAFGIGSLALTGARTWTDVLRASVALGVHAPMTPAHVAKPVAAALARRRPAASLAPLLRGSAVALVLLVVFGSLFASADPAFASIADRVLFPDVSVGLLPVRVLTVLAVTLLVGAGAIVARAVPASGLSEVAASVIEGALAAVRRVGGRGRPRVEWVLPLAALDGLFAAFVLVQVPVFFGGRSHLLGTPGLTAAEYAREGFFQLLAVAALTLGVVAAAVHWAGPRERRLLRALLGPLCVLTCAVLVSAAIRLHHYERMFGYTRLRLVVAVAIVWIALVLALVCAAGARWRADWLPRAVVATAAAAVLGLNAVNADGLVARRNIERHAAGKPIDVGYLKGLSADAVGELDRLPEPLRSCALAGQQDRLDELAQGGWRAANLSRRRADLLLDRRPADLEPAGCPAEPPTW